MGGSWVGRKDLSIEQEKQSQSSLMVYGRCEPPPGIRRIGSWLDRHCSPRRFFPARQVVTACPPCR